MERDGLLRKIPKTTKKVAGALILTNRRILFIQNPTQKSLGNLKILTSETTNRFDELLKTYPGFSLHLHNIQAALPEIWENRGRKWSILSVEHGQSNPVERLDFLKPQTAGKLYDRLEKLCNFVILEN